MRLHGWKTFRCERCGREYERRAAEPPTTCFGCEWQIAHPEECTPKEPATTVYCVRCVPDDVVHIFSTMDKAKQFCADDDRGHVIYDYVVDFPERMEQLQQ